MYCIDDRFYSEIDEMVESAIDDFKTADDIPSDFSIEYYDCELKPIFKLDAALLSVLLSDHFEENSSEDGDEWDGVQALIEKNLNFDPLNESAPTLWFPTGKPITMSRGAIIEIAIDNEWFN